MELYIAFGVFIATMLATIATGHSMIIALLVGLVAFLAVGRKRGFALKSMMLMSRDTLKDALLVVKVMLIIGALTAVWRVSGTIIIFVYYGMKIIMPPIFLLVTFLLCCLLSYAIGTSFGVASTVGVIFMALAESGGVNPLLAGGAVMSGIYFGDRCSPVSSSANMVAGITGTQIYDNVKMMLKTGLLPFLAALAAYVVMSVTNPMNGADSAMMTSLEEEFTLSLWAFIPAIIIIGLPLLKVGVIKAMAASIVSGVLIAWLVQGETLLHIARVMVLGYENVFDPRRRRTGIHAGSCCYSRYIQHVLRNFFGYTYAGQSAGKTRQCLHQVRAFFGNADDERGYVIYFLQSDSWHAYVLRHVKKTVSGRRRNKRRTGNRYGEFGDPHCLHAAVVNRMQRSSGTFRCGYEGIAFCCVYVCCAHLLFFHKEKMVQKLICRGILN